MLHSYNKFHNCNNIFVRAAAHCAAPFTKMMLLLWYFCLIHGTFKNCLCTFHLLLQPLIFLVIPSPAPFFEIEAGLLEHVETLYEVKLANAVFQSAVVNAKLAKM